MYIQCIEIKCLLGFRQLRIYVDSDLQLIAGPNNAGKSSLITLLEAFFGDPSSDDMQRLKPLHTYYLDGGPRMMSSIKLRFSGLSENELHDLEDVKNRDDTVDVELTCTRKGRISYRTRKGIEPTRSREVYERILQAFNFVKIPSVRVNNPDGSEHHQSLTRLHETLEGVLIRSGNSRSTQLQKDFAAAIEPVEELVRDVLRESIKAVATELPFQEPLLGVSLPGHEHALRGMLQEAVITSHDDVMVSIAERGTGFQSALVMGILRHVSSRGSQSGTNTIFAIEEPEAFLHPQTQRAMAKVLKDIARDSQLIITTHSPVLVDSFSVRHIARLPLAADGTMSMGTRLDLATAEEGRLTRYCDATNSELIFASSVIIVEGYGDKLFIDFLLERLTGGAGGHYALGIAVIEAAGITTIAHLLKLAQLFEVRAYVVTDKDGVHRNGDGKRALLEILKAKDPKPSPSALSDIRNLADRRVVTLAEAITHQNELNALLQPWDAFVLSSDLEGLLLDTVGQDRLAKLLGPDGTSEVDQPASIEFAKGKNGWEAMASWLGSKGWNSDRKKTGKAKPHLPAALLRQHLSAGNRKHRALRPLQDWLEEIVETHRRNRL